MLFPIFPFFRTVINLIIIALNMLMFVSFGQGVQAKYGGKYVWLLYLTGALLGSISMSYFQPVFPVSIPKVGAEASIWSLGTFFSLLNPTQKAIFFVVPVPMWVRTRII
jgi:membrane associated rhomboid family serine protease